MFSGHVVLLKLAYVLLIHEIPPNLFYIEIRNSYKILGKQFWAYFWNRMSFKCYWNTSRYSNINLPSIHFKEYPIFQTAIHISYPYPQPLTLSLSTSAALILNKSPPAEKFWNQVLKRPCKSLILVNSPTKFTFPTMIKISKVFCSALLTPHHTFLGVPSTFSDFTFLSKSLLSPNFSQCWRCPKSLNSHLRKEWEYQLWHFSKKKK